MVKLLHLMQENENKKVATPVYEPRTFRTKDRCPIPYTTVSLGKFCKKIKNVYIQGQKCPKILGGKFKSRKIQKCKVLYSQLICYSIKKSSTFDMFSIITYSALASPFHNKSSTTPNLYSMVSVMNRQLTHLNSFFLRELYTA